MVGHARGKHESRVIPPIEAVEPGGHTSKEAGAAFGLPVGRQRPATRYSLCPQVHHIEEVVVKKEGEHLAKTEQREVCRVLHFDYPGKAKR